MTAQPSLPENEPAKPIRDNIFIGLVALLPITILVFFFRWLYYTTTDLINPLTRLVVNWLQVGEWFADLFVLAFLIGFCFMVGLVVRTRLGGYFGELFSRYLLRKLPGYRLVKETIAQFIRTDKASPFSKVAVVKFYAEDIGSTAFVTAEHDNGYVTVFVPTGPNPTSGLMFHVPEHRVVVLPQISVDVAMRTVIGCGVGAQPIVNAAFQPYIRDEARNV